jgi:heterodisulfide reductase subunit A
MDENKKIGVFLCQCDGRIDPWVDLKELQELLKKNPLISQVEILPMSCTAPGLSQIKASAERHGLNRLVIAGCEPRVLLKKFNQEFAGTDVQEGQIDMVNLKDHVAAVHKLSPAEMAAKGAKLIGAAAAGLEVLEPTVSQKVEFVGPVMVLGGGIATYAAAQ